jgi:hypothetical protein
MPGSASGKLYASRTKYWATELRKDQAENISLTGKDWGSVKDMPEDSEVKHGKSMVKRPFSCLS